MPHSQEMAAVPEESNDPETFPVKHAVEKGELVEGGSNFLGAPEGRARKAVLNPDGPSAPTSTWSRTTAEQTSDNCM
jgi:hypothetical protein